MLTAQCVFLFFNLCLLSWLRITFSSSGHAIKKAYQVSRILVVLWVLTHTSQTGTNMAYYSPQNKIHTFRCGWCPCMVRGESLNTTYRQTSNITHIKLKKMNLSRLVLQLSLHNPLKPGVKSRMKM